jgi:hypothetical protein
MIQMNSVQPHTSHFFHTSFNFVIPSTVGQTRQSSVVGIAIRLRAGRPGVRIPIGATNFPLLRSFQTGSGIHPAAHSIGRLRLKCDVTRAETRFRLSAKRTSPFKSAGASVQSNAGSRGVSISGSNAGYTMF